MTSLSRGQDFFLKNVRPYGQDKTVDINISGGKITAMFPAGTTKQQNDQGYIIDGKDAVVLPGLIDLHTHLRQPGATTAETIASGSAAAALGGYTAVHAMANTQPVADTAAVVEEVKTVGDAVGLVDVRPVGAITRNLEGSQLASMSAMNSSAARVTFFSDDGHCVDDPLVMKRAMEYARGLDVVIAQHAQDKALTQGAQAHDGLVSADLGLPGWPGVAEEAIIARDILLAQQTGATLHVCHVSTAKSAEIIAQAKKDGVEVTAEVTPHHLLLTDEKVRTFNPVFKVNPPLRTQDDTLALRQAVAEGTIDVIGTDHAPHTIETKQKPWSQAAMGMTGLETAVSVIQKTLVDSGYIGWDKVADIMSTKPAQIGKLAGQGQKLDIGAPAHLTVIDPKATRTISPEEMATQGPNSPFAGMELPGVVTHVFYDGNPTVLDGQLLESA